MTIQLHVARSSQIDPDGIPLSVDEIGENVSIQVINLHATEWHKKRVPSSMLLVYAVPAPHNAEEMKVCEQIDSLSGGCYSDVVDEHKFTAKEGSHHTRHLGANGHFTYATIIGLGSMTSNVVDCGWFVADEPNNDRQTLSHLTAAGMAKTVANSITDTKADTVVVVLKDLTVSSMALQIFITNVLLRMKTDDRFKSKKIVPSRQFTSLTILISVRTGNPTDMCKDIVVAKHLAHGTDLARMLVTSPPNYCNPDTLASIAVSLAENNGLHAMVLDRADLESLKMGAFLAVGKGSIFGPRLIHLTYTGEPVAGTASRVLCFVGKGITMDTGGYNLKIGASIELMKNDMGGAAAVLGAAITIGRLKPKGLTIHFILGAAENMISSLAYRPGDVVSASDGTTIDIYNTDAEGRLVLCDCLIYAKKLKPDIIVDIATLTGASMIGLGRHVGAVYSTSQDELLKMLKGAKKAAEPLWPMPLHTQYASDLESRIADISNAASSKAGGSITAALFLHNFVKNFTWLHLDVAAPTWDWKENCGTGYGVQTLVHYILL